MTVDNVVQPTIDFSRLGFQGGRIVVVGGHGGIGAAICQRARESGGEVVSLDTQAAIDQRGPLPGVTSLPVDVLDPDSVARCATRVNAMYEKLDGLVYVSGIGHAPSNLDTVSLDQWDLIHGVNLRGAFVVSKAFLPMVKPAKGSMIMVASTNALTTPPGQAAYSASKAGLVALAKAMARECAPDIRVNIVSPGITITPFMVGGSGNPGADRPMSASAWFGEEAARKRLDSILLGRFAEPDDIVAPILFLLGPGARYITGQTIHVNGGIYLP